MVAAAAVSVSGPCRRLSSIRPGRRFRVSIIGFGPYLRRFIRRRSSVIRCTVGSGAKPAWWPGVVAFVARAVDPLGAGRVSSDLLLLSRRILQIILGRSARLRGRRAAQALSGRAIVSADPAEHSSLLSLSRACYSSCFSLHDAWKAMWFTNPATGQSLVWHRRWHHRSDR